MIKKKQLLLLAMILLPLVASAHDIQVKNADGVTIYYNYFNNGTELQVTYDGSYYFSYSDEYQGNVVIPEEVTYMNRTRKVTSIGDNAFVECYGLTSVTIPNSVTSIGYSSFYGCSGLTSITIGNSVTSIGDYAFKECSGLKKVIVKDIAAWCGIKFGSSSNPLYYAKHLYSDANTEITNLIIPNSVTSIGVYAFVECSSLTSVIIPNSVTSIGWEAFSGCSGLTSVTIPSSVTYIGSGAFNGSNLTKTIWLTNTPPSGYGNASGVVNYVSNDQYSSLSNMIVYPFLSSMFEVDGVKYVPVSPSERTCDAIDCVYDNSAADTKISSTVSYKGVSMGVQKVQPYICYCNTFIENLTCDNDGAISKCAFDGCKNMKTLKLGNKITSIGDYAFRNCSSLQSLVIPNSVTKLGTYSFSGCKSLSKISIPKSVEKIGNDVFNGSTGLKEFIIEDRETELTLGYNSSSSPLFSDCPLDYVYIGGNINYGTSSSQGYSPFYRNTTLRKVVITDKETEISTNEFYGCTNLQEFTVGDGVTTFGDWAFSGCSSLKSLSFGTQLKTIGKEAFSDCASVTKIVSKAQTPPTCSTQALDDINKWNCTLTVPVGSMAAYQAADQWKDFFYISEGDGGDNPPTPEPQKCEKPTISYENGKLTFSCATDGAVCQYSITDTDIKAGSGNEVQLGVTYNISVYAAKAGYENSETATATLCWIDASPKTEGITNGIANIPAQAVLIQSEGGSIKVQGCNDGEQVSVYSINGSQAGSAISQGGAATINTNLQPGSVAIVKIGRKSVKVVIK
jgi:hypothetical protein